MKHNYNHSALHALFDAVLFAALVAGSQAQAATAPSFSIVSPQAGTTVASPVTLEIGVQGAQIGRPVDGLDHLHISVDGGPELALYQNRRVAVPLPAGRHTLQVELAGPTHQALLPPKSVTFTVR
ncbi:MAG: hypothetical protein ABI144_10385 [Gallionella sp.]